MIQSHLGFILILLHNLPFLVVSHKENEEIITAIDTMMDVTFYNLEIANWNENVKKSFEDALIEKANAICKSNCSFCDVCSKFEGIHNGNIVYEDEQPNYNLAELNVRFSLTSDGDGTPIDIELEAAKFIVKESVENLMENSGIHVLHANDNYYPIQPPNIINLALIVTVVLVVFLLLAVMMILLYNHEKWWPKDRKDENYHNDNGVSVQLTSGVAQKSHAVPTGVTSDFEIVQL